MKFVDLIHNLKFRKIFYVISDFLLISCFVLISFLSKFSTDIFAEIKIENTELIFMIVYTVSISLLTLIAFALSGVYKLLTRNYGFTSALYISVITFIVQLVGLIFILILLISTFQILIIYLKRKRKKL